MLAPFIARAALLLGPVQNKWTTDVIARDRG